MINLVLLIAMLAADVAKLDHAVIGSLSQPFISGGVVYRRYTL